MASPDEHKLTFLRGSGFLLSLVGAWDLMADESSQWPSQKGFLIFKETKIIAVIERNEDMRRGVEGTYAVEGNRIRLLLDSRVVGFADVVQPNGCHPFFLEALLFNDLKKELCFSDNVGA
jgi:hypothetical protein